MFRFLVISSILGLACANVSTIPPLDGRIVGGVDTTIESHPYQVLVRKNGRFNCGGSIITPEIILTAAHCLWGIDASELSIQYGVNSSGGDINVIGVERIAKHPNYNPFTYNNDVGVVRVKSPIDFSASAQPIALTNSTPAAGTVGYVTGYGTTRAGGSRPRTLKLFEVKIVAKSVCKKQYVFHNFTNRMMCGQMVDKDSCQGDSGGPLVVGGAQVGVVSWGIGCAAPGVYANVANLRSWIEETIASLTAQSDN